MINSSSIILLLLIFALSNCIQKNESFESNNKERKYYESGRLKSETILDTSSNSKHITNYFENGKIESELSVLNEQLNGLCIYYYPNGKLKSNGVYINRRAYLYKEFSITGEVIEDYSEYIDKTKIGQFKVKILNQQGQLTLNKEDTISVSALNVPSRNLILSVSGGTINSIPHELSKYLIKPTSISKDSIIILAQCNWDSKSKVIEIGKVTFPYNK
jgi:hypothetical protein